MDTKSSTEHFRAALKEKIEDGGRGAQARLAKATKINQGYLSSIINGTQPGSEEVREKIADYFGMTYEEMLLLGRWILGGKKDDKGMQNLFSKLFKRQKEEYLRLTVEEKNDFKDSENNSAFLAAFREYLSKNPNTIGPEDLSKKTGVSIKETKELIDINNVHYELEFNLAQKIASLIGETYYDMVNKGRVLLWRSMYPPSTWFEDPLGNLEADEKLKSVYENVKDAHGEQEANSYVWAHHQIIEDKNILPIEKIEALFKTFGMKLVPKEMTEEDEASADLTKKDKAIEALVNLKKTWRKTYLYFKSRYDDDLTPESEEKIKEICSRLEKEEKQIDSILRKLINLLFPYAKEAKEFKAHSQERADYIWNKGCKDSGIPEMFDQKSLKIIEEYKQKKLTDAELYNAATKWAKDKLSLIRKSGNSEKT